MPVIQVEKRDGRVLPFDKKKIEYAIWRCEHSLGEASQKRAIKVTQWVVAQINKQYKSKSPTVENIQDLVEEALIKFDRLKTAKAYIIYREQHAQARAEKERLIGKSFTTKLTINALTILRDRYLFRDKQGNLLETPDDMFRRVANNIAQADKYYDDHADLKKTEEAFYDMMVNLEFLPNTPTLMNAGTTIQQLAACYVLPIEDSIEGIFETLKNTAIVHRSGGGTGFSFSKLRPRNDRILSTNGQASGPIAYMRVFDTTVEAIKQSGKRKGANMAILRCDHPDILDFITLKDKHTELLNFNVSVGITEQFMKCLDQDKTYPLINPRTQEPIKQIRAHDVWDLIMTMAWKNGEPGVVFLDRINSTNSNPTPKLGMIESTNPCGEQPLLPYEACNLGSINLAKFIHEGKIAWEKLHSVVHNAVHFLDNVIDMNKYPMPQSERITRLGNRKIGLGVMGFADMLYLLGIPYHSEKAVQVAEKVMKFFDEESKKASEELALKRGAFPNWEMSIWYPTRKLRNATTTTIAPTGTISMIANCSAGIEPNYALAYTTKVLDGRELRCLNPVFALALKQNQLLNDDTIQLVMNKGTIQDVLDLPANLRKIFVVAYDIGPQWHVKHQAAFQKHVDNAISKTVNFPQDATQQDVETVFRLAYTLGCKGVTVYRDLTRANQVMNIGNGS